MSQFDSPTDSTAQAPGLGAKTTGARAKHHGQAPTRQKLRPRAPAQMSRVTTGKQILPGVDWRSAIARRYHDLVSAIAADQGGAERLSEVRLQLVRRFAGGAVIAEEMEAKLAKGEEIDVAQYATVASTLVRVAQRIGINRIATTVPSLADYLDAKAEEKATA